MDVRAAENNMDALKQLGPFVFPPCRPVKTQACSQRTSYDYRRLLLRAKARDCQHNGTNSRSFRS